MTVGEPVCTGRRGVRGSRVLRRGSGRNGGGLVVLRGQSSVVDLVLGDVGFRRALDIHERHRARRRALARRLVLGAPRQQFDTLHAAIPTTIRRNIYRKKGSQHQDEARCTTRCMMMHIEHIMI